MSATSSSFWSRAESLRDDLIALSEMGTEMYVNLEATDDPGQLADTLAEILNAVNAAADRIGVTIPAVRVIATAYDDVAALKP